MRFQSGITALAGLSGVAGSAAAQSKGVELPPIRQLGAVSATASEKFMFDVRSMRALPDGRLYVNDPFGRRVLLFDADLQKFQIIADTLGANGNTYGRGAGLIAFRGDSTLFVDPQSLSMLVLDANGKVARVMSVPNAQDVMSFAGVLGAAQTDPQIEAMGLGSRASSQPFSNSPAAARFRYPRQLVFTGQASWHGMFSWYQAGPTSTTW